MWQFTGYFALYAKLTKPRVGLFSVREEGDLRPPPPHAEPYQAQVEH